MTVVVEVTTVGQQWTMTTMMMTMEGRGHGLVVAASLPQVAATAAPSNPAGGRRRAGHPDNDAQNFRPGQVQGPEH